MHEAQLHEVSCFVTLTYDDASLPENLQLHYPDFQAFIRALRKRHRVTGGRIRFFMSGEYGSRTGRPHFHAILFGIWFNDAVLHSERNGNRLYTSETLSKCWQKGFASVGHMSFEAAAYVAGYVTKKATKKADYDRLDLSTGEIYSLKREFCRMSLKPGIGAGWLSKFRSSVYPLDRIILNGHPARPPRYYDVLQERVDPDLMASLKEKRKANRNLDEEHPRRLLVREAVAKAALSLKKRDLE